MQRPFKFTKLKLITGYILILLLGAIAIIFIYIYGMVTFGWK